MEEGLAIDVVSSVNTLLREMGGGLTAGSVYDDLDAFKMHRQIEGGDTHDFNNSNDSATRDRTSWLYTVEPLQSTCNSCCWEIKSLTFLGVRE